MIRIATVDEQRKLAPPRWLQRNDGLFDAIQEHYPAVVAVTKPRCCPRCGIGELSPPANGGPSLWCVRPYPYGGGCGVVVRGPVGPYWIWRQYGAMWRGLTD